MRRSVALLAITAVLLAGVVVGVLATHAFYAWQLRRPGGLARLDARQRQSIVLVFFHGLSHGDLARHLQQPLGTVKAWVRRGLASLRQCLAARD